MSHHTSTAKGARAQVAGINAENRGKGMQLICTWAKGRWSERPASGASVLGPRGGQRTDQQMKLPPREHSGDVQRRPAGARGRSSWSRPSSLTGGAAGEREGRGPSEANRRGGELQGGGGVDGEVAEAEERRRSSRCRRGCRGWGRARGAGEAEELWAVGISEEEPVASGRAGRRGGGRGVLEGGEVMPVAGMTAGTRARAARRPMRGGRRPGTRRGRRGQHRREEARTRGGRGARYGARALLDTLRGRRSVGCGELSGEEGGT